MTTPGWWAVVGVGVGAAAGWAWGHRQAPRPPRARPGLHPYLLDPALGWLMRAHGALGVWASQSGVGVDGARQWQQTFEGDRLKPADLELIRQRLEEVHARAGSGAERLDSGVLLFGSVSGQTAGMLLPSRASSEAMAKAGDDLVLLLDAMARRPMLERVTREEDQPIESVGSVGLRLAYQLERMLNAEVIVAITDREHVRVVGVSGLADRRLLDTMAIPGSPIYQVARGHIPSITSIADPLGGVIMDRRSRFTPAIILPIKFGEDPVGAIAFWSAEEAEPVAPVMTEVKEAIRSAGIRFVRALRMERLSEEATVDPLTGIRNRRGLEEVLGRVGFQQGALVYADLDRFKQLNDTLGHPAGDAALVHFARLIHNEIRGGDTAARIGGEEFAIWLPGASLSVGARIADHLRIRLGSTKWEWKGKTWPLSASFGVAACPETSRSHQNLASQADAALYLAKDKGRNRVEVAEPVEEVAGAPS
jgi:diguanylate cyclase (GGDEF)-like protein